MRCRFYFWWLICPKKFGLSFDDTINLKTPGLQILSTNYKNINLEELIETYRREACELRESLLSGASWDELKEKTATVTQLSIAIHSKNPGFFKNCNPAEFPSDRSTDQDR